MEKFRRNFDYSFRNALLISVLLVGAPLSMGATGSESAWEYKCVETDRDTAQYYESFALYLESKFNALGAEGWEMVGYGMNNGANSRWVCFKRQKKLES
jgi:hypothetical protein|tara:strand:- start:132 stop:428 length:297 start_codon:yes stop_codon:yes gene_type:complete